MGRCWCRRAHDWARVCGLRVSGDESTIPLRAPSVIAWLSVRRAPSPAHMIQFAIAKEGVL